MSYQPHTTYWRLHTPVHANATALALTSRAMQRGVAKGATILLAVAFSIALAISGTLQAQAAQAPAQAKKPLEAIAFAQKGIEGANYTLFSRMVDTDSIVHNSAGEALAFLQEKMQKGELSGATPVLALMLSGINVEDKKQVSMLTQMLSTEVRSFVASGVSGGHFAGKPNGKTKLAGAGALFSGLSTKAKRLIPGKVLQEKGDTALVSAVLEDGEAGRFPLELNMTRTNENWRVTGIHNLRPMLEAAVTRAGL